MAVALRRDRWLVIAVAIASLADAVTTWIALHGSAHESGFARPVIDAIGLEPVVLLRVLIPVVMFFGFLVLSAALDQTIHRLTVIAISVVVAFWFVVAAHNLLVIV